MPTYTVKAPRGLLSTAKKQRLASEITRAHREVTGAQAFFAQVVFMEIGDGDWFVGGAPLAGGQIFVHGQIRSGRPPSVKKALLQRLLDAAAAESGLPRNRTWAYIVELPPSQMAEYGHVLPEPGTEAGWLAGLPGDDRALMESTGQ